MRSAFFMAAVVAAFQCVCVLSSGAVPAASFPASPDTSSRTGPAPVKAQLSEEASPSSPWSVSWDVTYATKYLFQGADLSEGRPVLQPELVLGYRGFSATAWANHDLHRRVSNEFDFLLDYGIERGPASLSLGYTHIHYPHRDGWDPTQEVTASASLTALLDWSLELHYDFDAGKGLYSTLGLAREIGITPLPLSLEADLFYQNRYYEATGIPALAFVAGTSKDIGSISVGPSVSYYATWGNGDFRDDARVPKSWLFSLNISQSF